MGFYTVGNVNTMKQRSRAKIFCITASTYEHNKLIILTYKMI